MLRDTLLSIGTSFALSTALAGELPKETPMEKQISNAQALCYAVIANSYKTLYNCKRGQLFTNKTGNNVLDIGVTFPANGDTSKSLRLPIVRQISSGANTNATFIWQKYKLEEILRKENGGAK